MSSIQTIRSTAPCRRILRRAVFASLLAILSATVCADEKPVVLPPDNGLRPEQLGIVINENDPLSVATGNYYQQRRKIPADNVVRIRIEPGKQELTPGEFTVVKSLVDGRMPKQVQALALAWTTPYRVGCMSVTSAFTFGYDTKYCAQGCQQTAPSSYADSSTRKPFDSLGIRPSMLLAATSKKFAFELIERGIESDFSAPEDGVAYLIETDDKARSVRKTLFPAVEAQFGDRLPLRIKQTHALKYAQNVMFYFTGLAKVTAYDTNRYLPGAVADHLTSAGGQLDGTDQMSAVRWLEAGATGSYGTVIEPCAFVAKFPNPQILLKHYLAGETLIESYWKSVLMPGQGVFIGEPLARPYAAYRVQGSGKQWQVGGPALDPDIEYDVYAANKLEGPFEKVGTRLKAAGPDHTLQLPQPTRAFYRLEPQIDFGKLQPRRS